MKLLTGKNTVITGSSRGFGKAIAEEFIKQGANVLICATNENQLKITFDELSKIKTKKQQLYSRFVDISNYGSVIDIYNYATSVFTKVDILVNNAGIHGPIGPLETLDIADFKDTLNVNLIGTVSMCKVFIPHFKKNRYGKIINISGGGAANPRAFFTAYATSKAGVVRFTESIAEELKSYNINCNSVAPGALNTRLLDQILDSGPEKTGEEYYIKALKQKQDGGADPRVAAKLCVFLASEQSNNITGKLIASIWDDWKSFPKHVDEIKNSDVFTLRRITPKDRNLNWG